VELFARRRIPYGDRSIRIGGSQYRFIGRQHKTTQIVGELEIKRFRIVETPQFTAG
jgi:hypothetical protein